MRRCVFARAFTSMSIRRRLIAFALTVIVSTLAAVAATPVAIGQLMAASSADAPKVEMLCTCGHGADAQCPMHHHGTQASKSKPTPTKNRFCAGCRDSVDMTLTAMIGFAAPMVDRCRFTPPETTAEALIAFGSHPLDQVRPPTAPPPRG
jgi:hypothetical protein